MNTRCSMFTDDEATEACVDQGSGRAEGHATWIAFTAILLVALAAVTPFLIWGGANGHDFDYHIATWIETVHQLKSGSLFLPWAGRGNFDFGDARFLFYPPVSRHIAAIGLALFPPDWAPGLYLFSVMIVGGISMFSLARSYLPTGIATVAAALYAVNPYMLLSVYQRSCMSEMLAGAFFPLVILFVLRLERGWHTVTPLALIFGLTWLTNLPAAVIVTYVLGLTIAVLTLVQRSSVILVRGVVAMVLGIGLAAFYALPAAYEQRWVQINLAIGQDYRPQNWEYTWEYDAEARWFYAIVSANVYGTIALAAVSVALSWLWRHRAPAFWCFLVVCSTVAVFMILPSGNIAYTYLPKLVFIQFPWRWLFVLVTCVILLLAIALRGHPLLLITVALMIAVAGGIAASWRVPWYKHLVTQRIKQQEEQSGYEADLEFLPHTVDAVKLEALKKTPAASLLEGKGKIEVEAWKPGRKLLKVEADKPGRIALHLSYYPAWKVRVNGALQETAQDEAGRIVVAVPPGSSRVDARFESTPDRRWALAISLVSFGAIIVLVILARRYPRAKFEPGNLKYH